MAEKLFAKNLTVAGNLRKNKPEITIMMKPSGTKYVSSKFGLKNNMTMVNYVLNKGKAVIQLSTMYDDKSMHDRLKKTRNQFVQQKDYGRCRYYR